MVQRLRPRDTAGSTAQTSRQCANRRMRNRTYGGVRGRGRVHLPLLLDSGGEEMRTISATPRKKRLCAAAQRAGARRPVADRSGRGGDRDRVCPCSDAVLFAVLGDVVAGGANRVVVTLGWVSLKRSYFPAKRSRNCPIPRVSHWCGAPADQTRAGLLRRQQGFRQPIRHP